jgi:hypothetical protein
MYSRLSLSAAILLAGVGYASAQQPSGAQQPAGDAQQQQRHDQMLQTVPGKNGKEEPSSHLDTSSDARVFVDGKLNVPGAPQDGQTVPAKFSKHNAEIDALPTMAIPLNLTDDQKHRIADSVAKANSPVQAIDAKPADMLAVTTPTTELSSEITAEIPAVKDLKIVRTKDKILLVRANSMVVRDVIAN